MNKSTFDKSYNPNNRCYATYTDPANFERKKGLILDGRHNDKCYVTYTDPANFERKKRLILDGRRRGIAGIPYVFVDNFNNRVHISRIESIEDTGVSWALSKFKETID